MRDFPPAFGGGLRFCAHLVKWGSRSTPLGKSDAELPPQTRSALEIVQHYRKAHGHRIAAT